MTLSSRKTTVLLKSVLELDSTNSRYLSFNYPRSRIELASVLAIVTLLWRIRCIWEQIERVWKSLVVEQTSGRCQSSKTVTFCLPRFLSLEELSLSSAVRNGSTKNFKKLFLFGYFTKQRCIQTVSFYPAQICAEKPLVDPKNIVFGMGGLPGFFPTRNITAPNLEKFRCFVSYYASKKKFQNFWSSRWGSKVFFPK